MQIESAPQLMSVPVTVPLPTTVTVRMCFCSLNLAVTLSAAVILNGPHILSIPVQAPSHSSKT